MAGLKELKKKNAKEVITYCKGFTCKWFWMKEISTKYIRQTWTILDEVIQWRDTFKILKTEKDFFLLVILFIFSQLWARLDRVILANQLHFDIFSVNPILY